MSKYAIVRFLDEESPLWSELADVFMLHAKTYMRPNTIKQVYHLAIKSFSLAAGNPRVSEIDDRIIDRWHEHLKLTMQPHSIRTRMAALSAIFNYAVKKGLAQRNPFVDIKLPPPKLGGRILTDEDLGKFIAAIPVEEVRRACLFSLYTGMRRGEILSLEWSQVMADCVVIPAEKAKSKRGRQVLLHPQARELLGPRGEGLVFPLCRDKVDKALVKARKSSGLGRVRFHDMRHNWATRYFELTKDPWAVMDAGGWASEASMRPYQHMTKTRQQQIYGIHYSFETQR